ncbi:MAG: transcriptional regulator [Clostridiales bacterium GWF2_38_85]|nr:MAG: transcriptional regulator [Clostridiales bacterium GWF2_38_85]HBL83929.1 transcriptional regulator [Clostridiales bacterium]
MKLIFAIVNNDDSSIVTSKLTKNKFNVTKIASTGGFLSAGNTTFLCGVEDDRVNEVIEIIAKYSRKRVESVPTGFSNELIPMTVGVQQIVVGGATIFVINVERHERV